MIRHLVQKEINPARWDKVIARSLNANIFGYSWVLNRLFDRWDALVNNDYDMVMPLPSGKQWGMRWLSNPVPGVSLGVYSRQPPPEKIILEFLQPVIKEFHFIYYPLHKYTPVPVNKKYLDTYATTSLDLIRPYHQLKRSFHREVKDLVTGKSYATGTRLVQPNDLITMWEDHGNDGSTAGKTINLRNARLLAAHAVRYRYGNLWGMYSEANNLSAVCLFISGHQKTHLMYPLETPEGKEEKALCRLINRYLVEHSGRNLVIETCNQWFNNEENPLLFFGGTTFNGPVLSRNRLPLIFPFLSRHSQP
ncbi:MAG: hypothetical protein ACP5D1_03820 [Bacteroidales bacterium]